MNNNSSNTNIQFLLYFSLITNPKKIKIKISSDIIPVPDIKRYFLNICAKFKKKSVPRSLTTSKKFVKTFYYED